MIPGPQIGNTPDAQEISGLVAKPSIRSLLEKKFSSVPISMTSGPAPAPMQQQAQDLQPMPALQMPSAASPIDPMTLARILQQSGQKRPLVEEAVPGQFSTVNPAYG